MTSKSSVAELVEVMTRLRAEDGCPWDREQTHASLKPYFLEEVYEALEAIDAGDDDALCQELGDVLLQVVFHAQIAAESGRFDLQAVGRAIVDKLVRRHPHVFPPAGESPVEVEGAEDVSRNWEAIKRREREASGRGQTSRLDGVPAALPALMRAERIQARAARAASEQPDRNTLLLAVEDKLGGLRRAGHGGDPQRLEAAYGELLFTLVDAGRQLGLDAEQALRGAVDAFEREFRANEHKEG